MKYAMCVFIIYAVYFQKELEPANCRHSFIHLFLEHTKQLYVFILMVSGSLFAFDN